MAILIPAPQKIVPSPASSVLLGYSDHEPIYLDDSERLSGLLALGAIGTGKTTLEVNIILQDAKRGHGVVFVDPDGDAIDDIIARLPAPLLHKVILLEPGNMACPMGLNLLTGKRASFDAVADRLMQFFKRTWLQTLNPAWGIRMEEVLRAAIVILLHHQLTLAELPDFLKNERLRSTLISQMPYESGKYYVHHFWEKTFDELLKHEKTEWITPVINRAYSVLGIDEVLHVVGQLETQVHFRQWMDEGKIVLLKLSSQNIGEDAASFLGILYVNALLDAILSRADTNIENRRFVSVVIDEFSQFVSASVDFETMCKRIRKYGVALTVATQTLASLDEKLQASVKQLSTQVTFRCNSEDAEKRAPIYANEPTIEYIERERKLPVQKPLDFLVTSGRSHSSPVVNGFVKKWERFVRESRGWPSYDIEPTTNIRADKMGRVRGLTERGGTVGRSSWLSYGKGIVDGLNALLYQAMSTQQPRIVYPLWLFFETVTFQQLACFDNERRNEDIEKYITLGYKVGSTITYPFRDYCSFLFEERYAWGEKIAPDENAIKLYKQLFLVSERELDACFLAYEKYVGQLLCTDLYGLVQRLFKELVLYGQSDDKFHDDPNKPPDWINSYHHKDKFRILKMQLGLEWFPIERMPLKWVRGPLKKEGSWRDGPGKDRPWYEFDLKDSPARRVWYDFYIWEWKLVPGIDRGWNYKHLIIAEVLRIIAHTKPSFEQAIREIRDVLQAVAYSPIMAGSGEYELVENKRRSVDDMTKEMRQELLNLPSHTCYVRIGTREAYKRKMQTQAMIKGYEGVVFANRKAFIEAQTRLLGKEVCLIEQELQERRMHLLGDVRAKVVVTELKEKEVPDRKAAIPAPFQPHPLVRLGEQTTPSTYLASIYYLSNITLKQAVRLAGLFTTNVEEMKQIYKREQGKINKLIGDGLVEPVSSEDTRFLLSGGRAPLVYRLKKAGFDRLHKEKGLIPINQGGFSAHAYKVNEVLITLIVAVKETPFTLASFLHERQFRQTSISVGTNGLEPDAWLSLSHNNQLQSLFLECDLRSEGSSSLKDKIRRYCQALEQKAHVGFTAQNRAIAFINPNGKQADTDRLIRIIEETIEPKYSPFFLVASVTIDEIAPGELLRGSIFRKPFDSATYPLLS